MPDYRRAARMAARKHGLNETLFVRQIGAESNFDPNAGSPKGARGIAQFTPGTAASMGVDLNDGKVSDDLDGAARLMASYVKKYGSYENALRAYNAGPGAIKASHGYAETNAYVAKILNGYSGKGTTGKESGGTVTQDVSHKETTFTPGTTTTDKTSAVVDALLAHKGLHGAIANIRSGKYTTTTPESTTTRTVKDGSVTVAQRAANAASAKGMSPLKELFWQGQNGIDAKDGKVVPQGFVSGHQDHVHVAAGPKTIQELGHLAQSMGLHVGENPHFGGVNPVHVKTSYHYKGEAIDVSGDPKLMAKYAHKVASIYHLA